MEIEKLYGPTNVIVTLSSKKLSIKRRLSQSKLPADNIPKRKKGLNDISSLNSINQQTSVEEEEEEEEEEENENLSTRQQHWPCHTKVLFNESPYFASLFSENFSETNASIAYLPSSIIDSSALNHVLKYMYTHQIYKPKELKELCDMYSAADYLGMDELCVQITKLMMETVHNCNCYCNQCQCNVSQLFPFCRMRAIELQDEKMAIMTQKIITILANDPEKTLSTFWASRHMAHLLIQLPQDVSQALSLKVLHRVNKSNAIESLYACFSTSNALSIKDPLLSWTKPLHATLTSVQSCSTKIIASHFDFFCREYPALLSCIDGITYSFDFLEYLLLYILEDQMDYSNVGILYQGIVCDLMSRHAVQYNDQVKHILNVAKVMILHYIIRRLGDIRQQGGLDNLEKSVLKQLADEINVRPKSLISSDHPLFHRGLFSFLLPSIPTLHPSTSTQTNRLSRYSSRSTTNTTTHTTYTTQRHLSLPSRITSHSVNNSYSTPSFTSHLTRLLKKLGSYHSSRLQVTQTPSIFPNRTLSTSTTRTTASTSSWSHVKLEKHTKRKAISFSPIVKQKTSLKNRQVSAPMIGLHRRVQLIRRPILTVGTVAYVGCVNFAEGIWVGVELDRRVGKNDGSVDGFRYFASSPNRGVFVRPEDIALVV
ncbi:uncharacterized protein BX663DRAFT_492629 [Cokeromyces recurvatus]|uniref:uncharacterized protein n=1 Tax=Cokeromyces recurvatus TaxID=90255 RepID=UPI00221FA2E0|nr:uncharacterized protein BX663DRAFT_492629 [Cokeromyces recurvatus]KAI7907983.1 hypothetical protein BX663DRAFT_492629 [Cokeromyces recurvatus]